MTTFTVPGVKGKRRPRFARHGTHVTTYTPDSTVAYEQAVQLAYQAAGGRLHDGAVAVRITAHQALPQRATKAQRLLRSVGKYTLSANLTLTTSSRLCLTRSTGLPTRMTRRSCNWMRASYTLPAKAASRYMSGGWKKWPRRLWTGQPETEKKESAP